MTRVVRAPGRVNLLGEHTDYNDGFVLPVAIDRFTTVEARERSDGLVRVEAADLDETDLFPLDLIERTGTWRDYVRGVVQAIAPRAGAHLRITSTLPRGAGLSSSAALEVAVGRALSDIPGPELAILCRRAENEFVGVQCGIMDQFTVANARDGHALLLDCRDLSFRHIPMVPGVTIVVCDSHVERRLTGSAYNERREACERAAAELGVSTLRDAQLDELGALPLEAPPPCPACRLGERPNRRRGARARQTVTSGPSGALMNDSHVSLRDDFAVCPPALDLLAAAARGIPGCYGARLTGAGFGGCTVALVETGAVEDVRRAVEQLGASVYECEAAAASRASTHPHRSHDRIICYPSGRR